MSHLLTLDPFGPRDSATAQRLFALAIDTLDDTFTRHALENDEHLHTCLNCRTPHDDLDACPTCGELVDGVFPPERSGLCFPDDVFDPPTLAGIAADTLHAAREEECLL